MRILLVILFAVIAIGSAGVWALGQFGDSLTSNTVEAREPLVIEPEVVVAAADTTATPAPPPPVTTRSAPAQRSQPAAPKAEAPAASAPAPAPVPALPPPAAETQAAPATPTPVPADAPASAPATAAKPNPLKPNSLNSTSPAQIFPQSPAPPATTPAPTPAAPPQATAEAAPPPPPAPAADPVVKPQQVERAQPAQAQASAQASAPAASTTAGVTASLASQFKSRKVTYNRPPEKLALNKAIDVSLVINATANEDAGKEALQGFPGTVVERDVDLSDIVSAQLTGVGFDITSQTVERQKLSGRDVNRWQWRVTPTETGTRTLILEIFGYESGSLDAEPLSSYRDPITVEVQQLDQVISWAKMAQPVFAVLAALAGAISAGVAFLRFRDERKAKKAAKTS